MAHANNYIDALKSALIKANVPSSKLSDVLSVYREKWETYWLSSYNHWRLTGDIEHRQHMDLCKEILEGLENLQSMGINNG
jgi:hypothetical protein